jgi:hypothetical protein
MIGSASRLNCALARWLSMFCGGVVVCGCPLLEFANHEASGRSLPRIRGF